MDVKLDIFGIVAGKSVLGEFDRKFDMFKRRK